MPDVTEQLAAYFDATVERVTAEDVLAGSVARVQNGGLPPTRARRLRPASVLAAGFVATIVVVGGAVGITRLLEGDSAGLGTAPPVGDSGEGLSGPWGLLIAVAVIVALAVVGLFWRGRNKIVKEQTMQTLEKPEVEVSPRPRSPAILVVLAVLLVGAAGVLGWWIGSSDDDVGDVPEIVNLVNEAWVDDDPEALIELYTENAVFEEMSLKNPTYGRVEYIGRADIRGHLAAGMQATGFEEFTVDTVIVLDNLVITQWTAIGTQGTEPFEATGVWVFEMKDGLIARSSLYYDHSEVFG